MPKFKEIYKAYQDVFDYSTLRALNKLANSGYLRELVSTISEGKEAVTFLGRNFIGEEITVKIYKVLTKDYRTLYKYLILDPRFEGVRRSRIDIIYNWVKKEYRNLNKLYRNRVSVPMPIVYYKNILLMEFIGNKGVPAPLLKDLHPEDPEKFWDILLKNIKRMVLNAGLVHGDLSEYNILNYNEVPVIIDVSQAILVKAPSADELLKRDLKNICNFFGKLGVDIEWKEIYREIIEEIYKKKK